MIVVVGDVGDAGKIAKTLDTIAKVRDGGNFGKIKIVGGKIHIGDVTIGSDGSKIIENGLKDINNSHGGVHAPNIHDPGVHDPAIHDPSTHSPAGAHALPDKNAVAATQHLPATDPTVARQVAQVDHAIHPQLQHEASQAWKSANDPTSQRWHDYQAAHGGTAPSKAVVGTWAHTDLNAALRAKAGKLFPHDSGYRIRSEISFDKTGGEVVHGTQGSIRPDITIERRVVEPDGQSTWQVVQVYDLKTGARGLSTKWVAKASKAFGIDRSHIDAIYP